MSQQDNLAHNTYVSVPLPTPQTKPVKKVEPSHVHTPASPSIKRRPGFTNLEKTALSFFSFLIFGLSILNISAGVNVNSINQKQQDIVKKTTEVHLLNTNLEQQVQELSRYDRIYSIAQQFGLKENEENVRNVSK